MQVLSSLSCLPCQALWEVNTAESRPREKLGCRGWNKHRNPCLRRMLKWHGQEMASEVAELTWIDPSPGSRGDARSPGWQLDPESVPDAVTGPQEYMCLLPFTQGGAALIRDESSVCLWVETWIVRPLWLFKMLRTNDSWMLSPKQAICTILSKAENRTEGEWEEWRAGRQREGLQNTTFREWSSYCKYNLTAVPAACTAPA